MYLADISMQDFGGMVGDYVVRILKVRVVDLIEVDDRLLGGLSEMYSVH